MGRGLDCKSGTNRAVRDGRRRPNTAATPGARRSESTAVGCSRSRPMATDGRQ